MNKKILEKPMTNADRVRAMSDEEPAEFQQPEKKEDAI